MIGRQTDRSTNGSIDRQIYRPTECPKSSWPTGGLWPLPRFRANRTFFAILNISNIIYPMPKNNLYFDSLCRISYKFSSLMYCIVEQTHNLLQRISNNWYIFRFLPEDKDKLPLRYLAYRSHKYKLHPNFSFRSYLNNLVFPLRNFTYL